MCQEKCPVKINTGELIKQLRSDEMAAAPRASAAAMVGGLGWIGMGLVGWAAVTVLFCIFMT
jgi:L-lactate utilization protein LutB